MEPNKTSKCETCGCMDGSCSSCAAGEHHGMMGMGMWHRKGPVRLAMLFVLIALGIWASVAAISGIMSLRYIGSGITPSNTINVTGSGKIFAVPDTATFSFTIKETGKDVGTAQKLVTTKMNDITAYLKSVGTADRDIQTTSYDATPKYDQSSCGYGAPCPTPKIIGYDVSETVSVKVRDTEKAGDVLSNVGGRGVSYVSGLSFTVDDQELLQQNAREKAITDARAKAEALARDLGVTLVRVVGFYDNSGGPIMYASKSVSMDSGMGGAVPPTPANIQVGENTITSTVSVTYEIR